MSDRPRRVDRHVVAELLKEAVERPSRSVALGAVLFEELLPAELKDELARADNLVLQVDEMTADVPWEMLVDRLSGAEPLACRAGLLRQFRTSDLNPRTGSGVARTAFEQARTERKNRRRVHVLLPTWSGPCRTRCAG